jgi:essential nuclear protein 1
MTKVKKIRSAALTAQSVRHAPLGQVLVEDEYRQKYAVVRNRQKSTQKGNDAEDGKEDDDDVLLDERTTKKILQLSREQQMEIQQEEEKQEQEELNRRRRLTTRMDDDDDDDDNNDEEIDNDMNSDDDDDDDEMIVHDNGYVTIQDGALSAEDEAIVEKMIMSSSLSTTTNSFHNNRPQTLADIIMSKIAEQEKYAANHERMQHGSEDALAPDLPPKVVQVYTDIGNILSRYTSGKLPKAFKVIPSLSNWEDVLYLTRPDMWSPMAMYAATKIFASNLNPKMAQRFYNLVLLDAVRADIVRHHKLNYHYYMALKKSVYKPAAFFKGILLPLCQDEQCTLREAAIVASVLTKVSIPVHHAAVAIHKLAATTTTTATNTNSTTSIQPMIKTSGVRSLFLRAMLQKKYSLPTPVLKQLVQYFVSFIHVVDERQLPLTVLWHQSLLVFLQRYKGELQDCRDDLKRLMKQHFHPKITPECRRELFGAQAYKDERMEMN